jgi:hypothetical protein
LRHILPIQLIFVGQIWAFIAMQETIIYFVGHVFL